MTETFSLSKQELGRLEVLCRVAAGLLTAKEAGELLELSVRQVRRLLAAYRKGGPPALAHGNRGRKPAHATKPEVRDRVLELVRTKYADYNHQHLSEVLEGEGVKLSRPTIRRILGGVGLRSPRKRRAAKHRRRRERWAQEGMLVQADGSDHDWLEGRGPRLCLVAGVDDATGKIVGASFRRQEDAQGYFLVLEQILTRYGIPLAFYHDLHGIFVRSKSELESLAEQLQGRREPTQFGRALEELGIASVDAHSPQAKGRIERLFGTLQDRLVKTLREAGAKTLEEANRALGPFVERHNARFSVPAEESGLAYRELPRSLDPKGICCFKYVRVVGADNTVRFAGETLQILPSKQRASYARLRVEVQERLDGSLRVYSEGRCLTTREAPLEARDLRARRARRAPASGQASGPGQLGEWDEAESRPSARREGGDSEATAQSEEAPALSGGQSGSEVGNSTDQARAEPVTGAEVPRLSAPGLAEFDPASVDKWTGERKPRSSTPGSNHPWRTKSSHPGQQLSKQG
jgi:transposase